MATPVARNPAPVKAYAAMALAMVFVGSSVVAGKLMIASFPVFLASGLRFALSSAILVPLLLWREGRWPRLSRRDWLYVILLALTGVFLFNIFLLYGLRWTSAAESGIIISASPPLIGLMSYLVLRERFTAAKALGIALAALGIAALWALPDGRAPQPALESAAVPGAMALLGGLLVLGATLGEALFTILAKLLSRNLSPLAISTVVSLLGLGMFLPFAVREGAAISFGALAPAAWLAIAYYAVFITVGATLLWFYGVSQVAANTAATFNGLLPVCSVLLSYAVLGEAFRWSHLAGGACVLAGILISTRA